MTQTAPRMPYWPECRPDRSLTTVMGHPPRAHCASRMFAAVPGCAAWTRADARVAVSNGEKCAGIPHCCLTSLFTLLQDAGGTGVVGAVAASLRLLPCRPASRRAPPQGIRSHCVRCEWPAVSEAMWSRYVVANVISPPHRHLRRRLEGCLVACESSGVLRHVGCAARRAQAHIVLSEAAHRYLSPGRSGCVLGGDGFPARLVTNRGHRVPSSIHLAILWRNCTALRKLKSCVICLL